MDLDLVRVTTSVVLSLLTDWCLDFWAKAAILHESSTEDVVSRYEPGGLTVVAWQRDVPEPQSRRRRPERPSGGALGVCGTYGTFCFFL